MAGISSNEIEGIYKRLLMRYEGVGYINPEAALNYNINRLMDKGETREDAILHLYRQEAKDGTAKQAIEHDIEAERQIVKLREKIDNLTVAFSKGEITEETYLRAVKKIEEEIVRVGGEQTISTIEREQLRSPSTIFRPTIQETRQAYPSALWWLVPFFFGIIGGIVAYVGVKDDDEDMALNLLLFGIIWTVILGILYFVVLY